MDFPTENIASSNGRAIAEKLRNILIQEQSLNVMPYNDLTSTINDTRLNSCFDQDCAVSAGSQLKVNYIVIGKLTQTPENIELLIKLIQINNNSAAGGYKIVRSDMTTLETVLPVIAQKLRQKNALVVANVLRIAPRKRFLLLKKKQ